jgi:hypothetical protein
MKRLFSFLKLKYLLWFKWDKVIGGRKYDCPKLGYVGGSVAENLSNI